ncbi:FHA domain-containing protein [Roseobacter sinensis]|uniref:FHA domain-containing protein n=1 Tax=Roseobacter sinensis TaxID=2931391 RepID=A0ABT3BJ15_9RHOB|nr:FHA domain-containing protein [Roseobacter sp. WL0113]MCV3273119.1 FHA domain-containing protein [Roseobacter sp. WL0113]
MTLFRKVFQNQSTPATGDEGLDEDALREAFMETSDERVLSLDPFAVAETGDDDDLAADLSRDDDVDDLGEAGEAAPDVQEAPEAVEEEEDEDAGADIAAVLAQTRLPEEEPRTEADDADEPEPEDQLARDMAPEPHETAFDDEPAQEMVGGPDSEADTDPEVVAFAKRQLELSVTPDAPAPAAPVDLSGAANGAPVPAPMAGRSGRQAGRVKTRLLGFNRGDHGAQDPIGATSGATATPQNERFPVGWLVVVEGPGVGHAFSIFTGASMIGRGEDQGIKLDFGDNSISRHNHAAIAYDEEQNKFYIGHGGKSNIIRRNARPVLSTEELHHADLIRIGETTLRFVALCGSDFKWDVTDGGDASEL